MADKTSVVTCKIIVAAKAQKNKLDLTPVKNSDSFHTGTCENRVLTYRRANTQVIKVNKSKQMVSYKAPISSTIFTY